MEFKIEIADAMINDAVKASVEAVVTDLIAQTDVIWEIVERCIEPVIIEFINSDRCNIDESVTEVIGLTMIKYQKLLIKRLLVVL